METRPAAAASQSTMDRDMQQLVNSLDPALRRVAFVGMPASMSPTNRIKELEDAAQRFPGFRHLDVGNFFKGPRNNREIAPVSYIEFGSPDVRDSALKAMGTEFTLSTGEKVKLKKAKTKVGTQRDYALRKASDMLKADAATNGKSISIEWKDWAVKVERDEVFKQEKTELGGTFSGVFAHLQLP